MISTSLVLLAQAPVLLAQSSPFVTFFDDSADQMKTDLGASLAIALSVAVLTIGVFVLWRIFNRLAGAPTFSTPAVYTGFTMQTSAPRWAADPVGRSGKTGGSSPAPKGQRVDKIMGTSTPIVRGKDGNVYQDHKALAGGGAGYYRQRHWQSKNGARRSLGAFDTPDDMEEDRWDGDRNFVN